MCKHLLHFALSDNNGGEEPDLAGLTTRHHELRTSHLEGGWTVQNRSYSCWDWRELNHSSSLVRCGWQGRVTHISPVPAHWLVNGSWLSFELIHINDNWKLFGVMGRRLYCPTEGFKDLTVRSGNIWTEISAVLPLPLSVHLGWFTKEHLACSPGLSFSGVPLQVISEGYESLPSSL